MLVRQQLLSQYSKREDKLMMKIDWSGRSHNYSAKDIKYLVEIIKKADPLTQGKYLKKFESDFSNYIGKKNVFAVSSAAAGLELIAALLDINKRKIIIDAVDKVVKIETATEPKFQEYFVDAMKFSVSPVKQQQTKKVRRRKRVS